MTGIAVGVGIGPFSGASPFNPTKVSSANCVVWLRADEANLTLDGSNNVQTWLDQSGNGNDLTQATATKRPPRSTNGGPNGTPYVGEFDGSDDFLRATFTLAQPTHAFVVCTISASGTTNATVMDGSAGNTLRLYIASATQVGIFAGGTLNLSCGAADIENWAVFEAEFNGASSALDMSGETRATGNAGTSDGSGLILGAFGDQTSAPADCRISEVILYDAILSAADDAAVNSYLDSRYGSLPINPA